MTGTEFKKRSEMHWARKIWHMGGVSTMALIYHYLPTFWSIALLSIAWLLWIPLDIFRLRSPALNDILIHIFRPIMRDSEAKKLAGTTYLLTGVFAVVLIFPREVTLITLLYLAFGDPLASVVGIKYGKDKIFGHKSVQGSFAAFAICALITFLYLYYNGIMVDRILIVTLLGGLIGATAEVVPLAKIDDNLSIPIVSATGLWALFAIFDGFSSVHPP